jgi:hypothetical protein
MGNHVWISKAKRTFEKEYLPNWTTQLFTTSRKVPGCSTNQIEDDHEEELEGTFYAKELSQDRRCLRVREVLAYKKRRVGKKKIIPEVNMRWKEYPTSFDSWILQPEFDLPVALHGKFLGEKVPKTKSCILPSYSYA